MVPILVMTYGSLILNQITWTLKAVKSTFKLGFGEDHGISYMPLSHTAGQVGVLNIMWGCTFVVAYEIACTHVFCI